MAEQKGLTVKLYSKGSRVSAIHGLDADHEAEMPTKLLETLPAEMGGAHFLEHFLRKELERSFDLRNASERYPLWFIDDEGDEIYIDNVAGFAEAWKFLQSLNERRETAAAAKPATFVSFLVDAPVRLADYVEVDKESVRSMETLSTMSQTQGMTRTLSQSSDAATACMDAPDQPPSWLAEFMKEMKQDLKNELLGTVTELERRWATTDKPSASHRAHRFESDCDLCCRNVVGHRYVCLSKCWKVFCQQCAAEHAADHVMLLVPNPYRGRPRMIAAQAEIVLRSMKNQNTDSKKSRDEKRKSKTHREAPPSGGVVATAIRLKIVDECEVRLMNDLGDDKGAYWKRWTLKNIGNVVWDDTSVKLQLDSQSEMVSPFTEQSNIPRLKPGHRGDLVVWLYAPVNTPGHYWASWRLVDVKSGDPIDGPSLRCDWTVGGPDAVAGVANGLATSTEHDDYSIIAETEEKSRSSDFELVSDEAPSATPSVVTDKGDDGDIPTSELKKTQKRESQSDVGGHDEDDDDMCVLRAELDAPLDPWSKLMSDSEDVKRKFSKEHENAEKVANLKQSMDDLLHMVSDNSSTNKTSTGGNSSSGELWSVMDHLQKVSLENGMHSLWDVPPPPPEQVSVDSTLEDTEVKEVDRTPQQSSVETGSSPLGPGITTSIGSAGSNNACSENRPMEPVNQLLLDVGKVATSVLQQVGGQVERVADRVRQWQPPPSHYQAWVPKATQTPSAEDAATATATAVPIDETWTPPPAWNGGSSATAANNTAMEGYARQQEALVSMGFADVDKNGRLLHVHDGDIGRVVDALVLDHDNQ